MLLLSCCRSLLHREWVCFDVAGLQRLIRGWVQIPGINGPAATQLAKNVKTAAWASYCKLTEATDAGDELLFSVDVVKAAVERLDVVVDDQYWGEVLKQDLLELCFATLDDKREAGTLCETKREPKHEVAMHDNGVKVEHETGVGNDRSLNIEHTSVAERKRQYCNLSATVLAGLLVSTEQHVDSLKSELQTKHKQISYLRRQSNRVRTKWDKVRSFHRKNKPTRSADAYHKGKGESRARLTAWGGVTLAVMRAVSCLAAWRTGLAHQTDVSRQTITRWENKTTAALAAATKHWYSKREEQLLNTACKCKSKTQFAVHCIRADATNAQVLHNESVQVQRVHHVGRYSRACIHTDFSLQYLRSRGASSSGGN